MFFKFDVLQRVMTIISNSDSSTTARNSIISSITVSE